MKKTSHRKKVKNNRFLNFYKRSYSGRSMVEILGVLAITGVLSIGAIYGYRFAMDKIRANEVIHQVELMAVSARTQITVSDNFNLDEFKEGDAVPYEFETSLYEDNSFSIIMMNIPDSVCSKIKSMWQNPETIYVNDEPDGECSRDLNDVEFLFTENEDGECDTSKLTCEEGQVANEKTCTCEACNEVCNKDGSDCRCNTTFAPSACAKSGKGCITCEEGETPKCSSEGNTDHACVCVKPEQGATCNYATCIACNKGEQPRCAGASGYVDACVCVPSGNPYSCGWHRCGTCEVGETPKCPMYGYCVCVKPDESVKCNSWACATCSAGETPICAQSGAQAAQEGANATTQDACICVKSGQSTACSGSHCIACDESEGAPQCDEKNGCSCVPSGQPKACSTSRCITCEAGETPKCALWGRGDSGCVCIKQGQSGDCSYDSCIVCEEGKTPKCPDGTSGPCSCVNSCSNHGTWNGTSCRCSYGWGGSECSENLRTRCSNHGVWHDSYCNCDSGWGGSDCSVDANTACSNHGVWYGSSCSCNSGWGGSDCSVKVAATAPWTAGAATPGSSYAIGAGTSGPYYGATGVPVSGAPVTPGAPLPVSGAPVTPGSSYAIGAGTSEPYYGAAGTEVPRAGTSLPVSGAPATPGPWNGSSEATGPRGPAAGTSGPYYGATGVPVSGAPVTPGLATGRSAAGTPDIGQTQSSGIISAPQPAGSAATAAPWEIPVASSPCDPSKTEKVLYYEGHSDPYHCVCKPGYSSCRKY